MTMKYLIATIALIVSAAAATCALTFHFACDPQVTAAVAKRDAMEWLRTDFQLTDAQFARIKQLHESYSSVCDKHCQDIMDAAAARDQVKIDKPADAAALAAANQKVENLRRACETAIAAHVRQCAAEMSPEAGQRYLALVLPKIADFDHQAAPDVRLNKHAP